MTSEPSLEPTAVVLIAHGSPDPDWCRPLDAVEALVRARAPGRAVVVAFLGFLAPTLAEAVQQLQAQGHRRLLVLAAFLSPGGRHLKEDLPRLVTELAAAHPELRLELRPGALGAEPEVVQALADAAVRSLYEAGSTNADASTS